MLGSRSIKLIWSIVLTTEPPIEQIDGFYIGYRPVISSTSSNGVTTNNVVQSSGSIIDPSTGIIMMIGTNAAAAASGGGVERITMIDQSNNGGVDQSTNNNNNNNKPVIISNNGAVNSNLNNGKAVPYTFKIMYEDHSKFVSSNILSMAIYNGSNVLQRQNNENKQPSNNHNMTTFCEVIRTSTDSDNGNINKPNKFYPTKQQQQQWSTMTMNQRSKSNGLKSRDDTQIRCVYEFVVNNLQRKTRYGFIIQAFNAKGTGPVSTEVYAQTLLKGNISY